MSTKLAAQTQKTAGIPNGMRTATIAAYSNRSVTISVAGGLISSGVGVVGSYVPVVGDTVAVFRQDSSWLILGSIAAKTIAARGQLTGTTVISFTTLASATQSVSFGASFDVAPVVTPNIDSGAGSTARWVARAIAVGTSGFTMFVFSADNVANTWSSVPVSWVATARNV